MYPKKMNMPTRGGGTIGIFKTLFIMNLRTKLNARKADIAGTLARA
jgi:hypothetical protein